MKNNKTDQFFQQIVQAISQAITVDAPREREDHNLETNNRNRYLVGDVINENLKQQVVSDSIELIKLNRPGWDGRLVADHSTSTSYTIIAQKTLKRAVRSSRRIPYYLQAILVTQNHNLEGMPKQMTMADFCTEMSAIEFTEDEFDCTYDTLLGDNAEKIKKYNHYVIVYEAESSELQSIELYLFDQDFATVEYRDLSEFIIPDFASLTEYANKTETKKRKNKSSTRRMDLVRLKPKIKEQR